MKTVAWIIYVTFILLSAAGNAVSAGSSVIGMGFAAVLPISLALVTFMLERVRGGGHTSAWVRIWGSAVVAAAAAVASFLHLFHLALEHGEPLAVAILTPLAFDGVILVASLTILAIDTPAPDQAPASPVVPAAPRPSGWVSVPAGVPSLGILPVTPPAPPKRPRPRRRVPAVAAAPSLVTGHDPMTWPYAGIDTPATDGMLLRHIYGDTLPAQRVLKEEHGWGSTRVAAAIAQYREQMAQREQPVAA